MILAPSADLDLAVRGILFGAVGTAGQRCTTLRRLIAHESVKDEIVARLKTAYSKVRIGHPLEGNLVGPLIDAHSYRAMQDALARAREQGGQVFGGERQLRERYPDAYYVSPAIVEMPGQTEVVRTETFAPILYVIGYRDFDEALRLNNEVPQGLSSCIFTTDLREAERFQAPPAATAGSPTSTSVPAARRSAAPSAARRTPAAVASPARTPGRPTCAGRPTPSTIPVKLAAGARASPSTERNAADGSPHG